MSSHVELNPDDDVLGLTLGMKAMRLALTQKTHKMGTVRIPGADGTDVIIGAGASDGVNRVDKDGRQLPLVDTSGIDKAAQDAQRKADDAIAKADEAIKQGEQIRRDAQAGIDDARRQAQAVEAKAEQVRTDLTKQVQNVKSEMDSAVEAAQTSADKAQSAADAARKAADKANASTADLDKSIKAVDAKAIAAKQAAAEAQSKAENVASDLDSANAVIEQHTTELGELTTKVSNAVKKSDSALSVSTEAKQTATEASTTATSAYKDSQTALTQSTTATQTATAAKTTAKSASKTATDSLKQSSAAVQTANQISTTLRTEYRTKADADRIYATQSSLKQTSDSITASVSKTYATKDALSALQNVADNAIESWRGTGVPTLTNKPASDWTTDADKRKHSGDLYYDKSTGKAYRFGSDDGVTYTWELNQDTDVTKALADASKAQTSANNAQASATAANTAAGKAQSTANTAVSNAATAKNAADAAQSSANKAQGDVDKLKVDIPATYATKSSLTQTAESITANVESVKTTANSAVTAASKAQQTADGISANLTKNYQTKSQADAIYATQSSLNATSDSISAEVTKAQGTADGAVTAASKAQQTADAVTLNLSKNYQTKAQNDALYATQTSLKATSDSLSANITANAKTVKSAVDKATSLEANLNGFKTAVSQTYGRGSNLWVNPTFDADKPQITTRVNNVTAPNGSGVNLLANRDHYNGSTGFPVVPGHVYAITAHIKRIKGNLDLLADIWYTEMTSGVSWDSSVIREPAVELTDGWSSMTWRVTCSSGKSKGCVNFRIDQWDHSTQFYVANLVCVDVTGLQPAGDYATNSSLTQTANSIKAQVTEVSKTANGAMSKATTVEQTANGLSSKITEQAKTLNATVRTANEAKSTADSNKTTISQVSTTASSALSKASTVEQNLNGFKTSVADTYQPKSGMGSYATQSQLTQTANQIRGEVSEKYQSKNGMSSYATNSALTQKANEITGKVTEVAKTAQGNATTISQVSQKADRINTTLSQQIGGKADTSRVSSLEQNLNGFKTSVAKTYQTKGDYPTKAEVQSRIDQSASSIKSTVGQTYTTLAATEELRKSAIRTFPLYGANGTGPKWVKLGYLISNGDSSSVLLRVYSGDGYNGQARQNAEFEIFVKDGWQGAPSASGAFGVSVRRIRSADDVKVKVMAFGPTTCDIWAYLPWHWWSGRYTIQGYYKSWQDGPNCGGERIQDNEPANGTAQDLAYDTLSTRSYVDQTSRSVALGVVQNYKGSDGSGLATKSDITVAKNSITSTVAGTYATKSGVTQEISSKITQNNNSLDVKFSTKTETKTAQDTANTAKSNASNAQSRVGALEDCISLTSAGVRAGHKSNGVFNGVSALVNTDGSFDLLDKDGNLLTRIDRHSLQVAGDDGVGSGHLILSQDGLDITVQPTANKKATYHIQLGAGGISITAPDGSHVNCSARTGLDLETVRYGKLSIGSGGLQFTNDQGWGLLLSAAGWSLKWAGNHTLATGPTAGKLYIDGREIMTR